MNVEAIIPAAGEGLRMGSSVPKPLLKLGSRPVIIHTLNALTGNARIKRIIIAVNKNHLGSFKAALSRFGYCYSGVHRQVSQVKSPGRSLNQKIDLVLGGPTRKDSVANCLQEISHDAEVVLVHDAVRPFVDRRLITALIREALSGAGAAISGVPVKNTIKRLAPAILDKAKARQKTSARSIVGLVENTIDRDGLWEIQTPQVFKKALLMRAYSKFRKSDVTDDAMLVERLGVAVKVLSGSYLNIKITTPEDLLFAEAILRIKESMRRKI